MRLLEWLRSKIEQIKSWEKPKPEEEEEEGKIELKKLVREPEASIMNLTREGIIIRKSLLDAKIGKE